MHWSFIFCLNSSPRESDNEVINSELGFMLPRVKLANQRKELEI